MKFRHVVAVALLAAACGGGEEAVTYEVTLDVTYEEELRVPGLGYVLHEFRLDYVLAVVSEAGVLVEPEPAGTANWVVRCYAEPFGPDQQPVAEFSGTHPAIFEWDRDDLRNAGSLEGATDWTAAPAVVLVEEGESLQIVHRLPSALAADRAIGCSPDAQYTAVALALGDGAMTAPGRVVTANEELSRAEALNAAGQARYVLGDDWTGWLVHEIPVAAVGPDLVAFDFSYDPGGAPEGFARIGILGTVRVAPE